MLSGCSLISDFDRFHYQEATKDDGSVEDGGMYIQGNDGGDTSVIDAGSQDSSDASLYKDAGTPALDSGEDASPLQELDGGSDSGLPSDPDSGSMLPDSGPIYPHGCTPPLQWCATQSKCMSKYELDINNGSCLNCKRNASTGEWICTN